MIKIASLRKGKDIPPPRLQTPQAGLRMAEKKNERRKVEDRDFTPSHNAQPEEKNHAAEVASKSGLVRATNGDQARIFRPFRRPNDHHFVTRHPHPSLRRSDSGFVSCWYACRRLSLLGRAPSKAKLEEQHGSRLEQ